MSNVILFQNSLSYLIVFPTICDLKLRITDRPIIINVFILDKNMFFFFISILLYKSHLYLVVVQPTRLLGISALNFCPNYEFRRTSS